MKERLPIKLGFCVAYDWQLLEHALPLVYNHADLICLSLDKDRTSWAGQPFSFDESGFKRLVEQIDKDKKIKVYQDDFHLQHLQPMENEVRQRNLMAEFMGEGGWHLQLDADEYFLDFKGFTDYLQKFNHDTRRINVCCPWITMYKKSGNNFLLIHPQKFGQHEFIQIATRWPHYEYGRRNGYFNILTDFFLLHQSWARTETEVWEKLNNWGHKNDIDVAKYFEQWKNCDDRSFMNYKNFHHLKPNAWPSLINVEAGSIHELSKKIKKENSFSISRKKLALSNSIWISRIRSMVGVR
jgi:hypothetical protein